MRCAILARKSNQQEATGDEKSVVMQERECRALIERNGWTLADGHLYVEDVVSGALMTPEGRPELFRLLAACEAKQRPFDVVVVSHEDRIGRDTFRSSMVIMRIIESGVRLVSVASGERKLDTPTDELLLAISGFMGSAERHSVSRRVRAKAFDNARRGHTTGLRAFGYESVEVNGHKELRVNAAEGEIVRWIFDLCQQGYGIRRIAHRLNEQHNGLHRWSHTGVRDILKNEIYIGQVVYGRTRNEVRRASSGSWRCPRPSGSASSGASFGSYRSRSGMPPRRGRRPRSRPIRRRPKDTCLARPRGRRSRASTSWPGCSSVGSAAGSSSA
jgi:site-specific DNA recombinase